MTPLSNNTPKANLYHLGKFSISFKLNFSREETIKNRTAPGIFDLLIKRPSLCSVEWGGRIRGPDAFLHRYEPQATQEKAFNNGAAFIST